VKVHVYESGLKEKPIIISGQAVSAQEALDIAMVVMHLVHKHMPEAVSREVIHGG